MTLIFIRCNLREFKFWMVNKIISPVQRFMRKTNIGVMSDDSLSPLAGVWCVWAW